MAACSVIKKRIKPPTPCFQHSMGGLFFPTKQGGGSFEPPPCCRVLFLKRCAYFSAARNRKVTIWARVQTMSGPKVVALVPAVMLFSTAHSTAS